MSDSSPRIKPFLSRALQKAGDTDYDGALASLGFERRSRQIPEALGIKGVAIPFGDHHELDYGDNLKFFESKDWEMPELDESEYFNWVSSWLGDLAGGQGRTRIAVDVSSMSRRRIADVVEVVFALPPDTSLDIDFLYTPAEFEDYDDDLAPPIFSVAPVSENFAGWWTALEKPLFAIVGLGYETEMAAGALDILEPAEALAFVPEGTDSRYLTAVRGANEGIGDWCAIDPEEVFYSVADPFSCFRQLEARVRRLQTERRVALVPLGPKIFALVAILSAAFHPGTCQVIRVSAGTHQEPIPRRSDGDLFGITLSLSPPPLAGEPNFD